MENQQSVFKRLPEWTLSNDCLTEYVNWKGVTLFTYNCVYISSVGYIERPFEVACR